VHQKVMRLFLFAILVTISTSCSKSAKGDPVGADIDDVTVADISVDSGEVFTTDTFSVTWTTEGTTQYKISSEIDSGSWSSSSKISSLDTLLSDGEYELMIRVTNGTSYSDTTIIPFSINSLTAPAAYMYPRFQSVKSVDDTISIDLYGKGVTSVQGFSVQIKNFIIIDATVSSPFSGEIFFTDTILDFIGTPGSTPIDGTVKLCTIKGVISDAPSTDSLFSLELVNMKTTTIDSVGVATTSSITTLQDGIVSIYSAISE